ncbi:MAG: TolC family protein [Bacteroidota bacterium]
MKFRNNPWFFLWILLLLSSTSLHSQTADTLFLGFQDFLKEVAQNHPIAQQAGLYQERAEAALLSARGGFDPIAEAGYKQKSFDAKNYYQYLDGGIRVPTWWGIELTAGYMQTDGIFLNPEANLPDLGQAFVGISFPLLQGFLIDANRANLKQAKTGLEMAQQDQTLVLNQLLFDAANTYWNWYQTEVEFRIMDQALALSQETFRAIRDSYIAGDRPAVDTLEAWIQVQDRLYAQQLSEVALQMATLEMSLFRWDGNGQQINPTYTLVTNNLPTEIEANALSSFTVNLNLHPQLRQLFLKGQILDIERRLKVEKLKPKLSAEYRLIANQWDFVNSQVTDANPLVNALLLDNYTAGLKFSVPLFLREARGDLKITDVKIQELGWKASQKTAELRTKLTQQEQMIAVMRDQQDLLANQVLNYERLLSLERQKLAVGESSIFLINSRENKLIEAQLKELSLQVKTVQSVLKWQTTAARMLEWLQ